jgi:hypothetical protein
VVNLGSFGKDQIYPDCRVVAILKSLSAPEDVKSSGQETRAERRRGQETRAERRRGQENCDERRRNGPGIVKWAPPGHNV